MPAKPMEGCYGSYFYDVASRVLNFVQFMAILKKSKYAKMTLAVYIHQYNVVIC